MIWLKSMSESEDYKSYFLGVKSMCSSKKSYMYRTYMINDAESYLNIDLTASKRNMNTTLMVLNKKQLHVLPSLHSTKVHNFLHD